MYITCKKITNKVKYLYQPVDIKVFDETPVQPDMVSDATADVVGERVWK